MTKVVINNTYDGFSLSKQAIRWLEKHKAFKTPELEQELKRIKNKSKTRLYLNHDSDDDMKLGRDNPLLVQCVETLGKEANGEFANLAIVEVEGELNKDFFIEHNQGLEFITY